MINQTWNKNVYDSFCLFFGSWYIEDVKPEQNALYSYITFLSTF